MGNLAINIVVKFFVLLFLQGLILNNINLGVYFNIYLYVLFLITLPLQLPGYVLLLLCFCMGLSIDVFLNTLGLHASALLFAGFTRGWVIKLFKPREGFENITTPTLFSYGIRWFILYSFSILLLHHTWLFFLEMFKFTEIGSTLLKIICSTLLNTLLVIIAQLVVLNPKNALR